MQNPRPRDEHQGVVDLSRVVQLAVPFHMDSPGQIADAAVAAPVQETPDAADGVADQDGHRRRIEEREQRLLGSPSEAPSGEEAENQAPKARKPAKLKGPKFLGVLSVVLQRLQNEDDASADDAQEQDGEARIGDLLRGEPVPLRTPSREINPDKEGDQDRKAVAVDLEFADLEEDGVHTRSILPGRSVPSRTSVAREGSYRTAWCESAWSARSAAFFAARSSPAAWCSSITFCQAFRT